MSSSWKPSDEERRAILFLEAAGLLHDLGKLSDKFLESQSSDRRLGYSLILLVDPRKVYRDYRGAKSDRARKEIGNWQDKADNPNIAAPFKERADLTQILKETSFTSWDGTEYNLAEMMPLTSRQKFINVDWSH
ncbi:MAG: hypothetical protein JRG72_11635, partial [Deltaproteobacteria bacterium]|nr:hypothetical protein [Deltaproteobacteria bacterium]